MFLYGEPFYCYMMNTKEHFLYECENANIIKKTFEYLRINNVEPLLIKGWLASKNYSSDKFRYFGDIDLIVPPTKYFHLIKLTDKLFPEVDLHNGARNHDTLSYEQLLANSELKKLINGYEIRVVCPEDHLRILAAHWLNDGGTRKDKLWDIYYAVSNRPETFDWEKCLNVVSPIRRKWVLTAIGLAHYYLELPIDDLPFANEIKQPNFIPKWIFETVEYEWKSDIHLRSLVGSFKSPKIFIQQIRKRFPPNPIQSAIETNTSFDDRFRIPSQVKAIFKRMLPQDGNTASLASTIYRKLTIRK